MTPTQILRLAEAIDVLPPRCESETLTTSDGVTHTPVMQGWTSLLPLRYQGVLVASIRGCDGAPKEDPSKDLSRMVRRAVLNPADWRETLKKGGFFGLDHARLRRSLNNFLHSLDEYPLHYVMHLMHASEVIGYCHPDGRYRTFFELVYRVMAFKFHLNPETADQMRERLTCDRIAAGTTERDFTL